MTLNEITDQFLAQVADTFPDYEVDHYPGDPEKYQFAHPKAAVLLVFQDRTFKEPQATDGTGQVNNPILHLTYFTRNLRGKSKNPSAYDLLEEGRAGLLGFHMGTSYVWCRREFYLTNKPGGIWVYGQDWQLEDYYDEED